MYDFPVELLFDNRLLLCGPYRTKYYDFLQGEMGANVLVGMQVPKEDEAEFIALADTLGYAYQDERLNEAYELIMH